MYGRSLSRQATVGSVPTGQETQIEHSAIFGRNMNDNAALDKIKVGVLFSQTGVTSKVERTQMNATLLAIEEANEKLSATGSIIEPIVYDPASKPLRYRHLAERLLRDDRAAIIFGCYMSSARRAVVPVVERWNALLCYPTFYEGFEYSKNVLYGGALPNQTDVMLARYILEHYGRKVYSIGSDYIFPHESNRLMRNILSYEGGSVVGEAYLPLDTPDRLIELALEDIERRKPDVVFSTIVGSDIPKFYEYYRRRFGECRAAPIASITATEAELSGLEEGVAEGHVCAGPYFASVNTPESRVFTRKYRERFPEGPVVNMCAEAAYYSCVLICDAIVAGCSIDAQSILNRIHGQEIAAPQGLVKVDPHNNHVYTNCRIGRVDKRNQFVVLEEADHPIRPDPYLVEYQGSLDGVLGQGGA